MSNESNSFGDAPNGQATDDADTPRLSLASLADIVACDRGALIMAGTGYDTVREDVFRVARLCVREGSIRELDLTGRIDSPAFVYNPFRSGGLTTVMEMLEALVGHEPIMGESGVFRERAVALMRAIAPVLVWLRDYKGVPLNVDVVRSSIELRWMFKLALQQIVLLRDPTTGNLQELDVEGAIPDDLIWPLKGYLGELPGRDPTLAIDTQEGGEPSRQHGYAQLHMTGALYRLARLLPRSGDTEAPVVDTRDVVAGASILLVHVPSPEPWDSPAAMISTFLIRCFEAVAAEVNETKRNAGHSEYGGFPVLLDAELAGSLRGLSVRRSIQLRSMS
jgi:intracellular multiplication protein IcmO